MLLQQLKDLLGLPNLRYAVEIGQPTIWGMLLSHGRMTNVGLLDG